MNKHPNLNEYEKELIIGHVDVLTSAIRGVIPFEAEDKIRKKFIEIDLEFLRALKTPPEINYQPISKKLRPLLKKFSPNVNNNKASQIEKYGGEAGYRAEMKRRRSLVKNVRGGFSDPQKAKLAQEKSVEKRLENRDSRQIT